VGSSEDDGDDGRDQGARRITEDREQDQGDERRDRLRDEQSTNHGPRLSAATVAIP
jgi:hypothetical protein